MDTTCDHCHQPVVRDVNGYWVNPPGSPNEGDAWCDANPDGHEVDGRQR